MTWYVAIVTGRISFDVPGVLTDLLGRQRRPSYELVLPLPRAHGVGDEDQRGRLGLGHRGRADDGLAGATGEYDDAGPAVPERLGGLLLVGPQLPPVLGQRDRVRLAVDVPGEVLCRPAQLEQRLLEVAALGRVHRDRVVVDPVAEHPGDLLGAEHLFEHRSVGAGQHQPVNRVLLEPQPAVAGHRLRDVDQQVVGDRVAAEAQQRVDDLLGVMPGGPCVPQPERREPVGVDVLRAPLQFGERRDRPPALGRLLVIHLEQQRLVRLHDEGAVGHRPSLRTTPNPPPSEPRPPVSVRIWPDSRKIRGRA